MRGRLFTAAFLKLRNLGILIAALGLSAALGSSSALPGIISGLPIIPNFIAVPIAIAIYLTFVIKTLNNKSFHDDFNRKEKIKQIQDLNYACLRLSNEAKKNTNAEYLQKLKKVMDDKNDIVDSFFRGEHSYLKEKIVEQTLNLVVVYLKLLNNFCIRNREIAGTDKASIINRLNSNTRKLSFTKEPYMAEDLRKMLEIDERLINRMNNEKKELEKIGAKLDYMESTVNMFKHQILSSAESEELLENIETAVNEAEALDNALEDRRKSKLSR